MDAFLDTFYNVILPILLVIGVGVWFGRRFQPDTRVIASLIIYLFAPALVIRGLGNAPIAGDDLLRITGFIFATSIVIALIGLGIARSLRLDARQQSAFILSVVLFNGANYGLPFNTFAYGEAAGEIAVAYYALSVIVANTIGVYLASYGTGVSLREGLLNIFRIPLIYATIIGIGLNLAGISLDIASEDAAMVPLPLIRVLDLLADATIPTMLVLIGIQLGNVNIGAQLRPMLAASVTTLILAPLVAYLLAVLFGLDGLLAQVGITQFAMPTAIIASALATQFGGDADFVTSVTLFSTVASVFTLSVLVAIIG